jgi:hypothetical protein
LKHPKSRGLNGTFFNRSISRTVLVWCRGFMDIATYGIGLFTPVILGAIHLFTSGQTVVADLYCSRQRYD